MNLPYGLACVFAEGIAPAVSRWAVAHERKILREGQPLEAEMLAFAVNLGIRRPAQIRVKIVSEIPLPVPRWIFHLARKLGIPVFPPGGMALGKGIYLLPGSGGSLPHELVHTLQYERLGGISKFMRTYLAECLAMGYASSALEAEARSRSE